jgi:hypothetical protein
VYSVVAASDASEVTSHVSAAATAAVAAKAMAANFMVAVCVWLCG